MKKNIHYTGTLLLAICLFLTNMKAIAATTSEADSSPAVTDVVCVLSVVIFYMLIRLLVNRYFRNKNEFTLQTIESEDVEKRYPMVRIGNRDWPFRKERGIILFNDSIAVFKKRKKTSAAALHEDGAQSLFATFKGIHSRWMIPYEQVKLVQVSRHTLTKAFRLKIITAKKTFRLTLPEKECTILLPVLQLKLKERFVIVKYRSFRNDVLAVMTIILTGVFVNTIWPGKLLIGMIILSLTILLGNVAFIAISKLSFNGKTDKSHTEQIKSDEGALTLKAVAVLFLVLWIFDFKDLRTNISSGWLYIILGNLLLISMALSKKNIFQPQKKNADKKILYLRSFLDDGITSLNPSSNSSVFSGAASPYHLLEGLEPSTLIYKVKVFFIKYIIGFHPLRIIRMFFGKPLDTSEEQLASFFRNHGSFVAIGKPGEVLTTLGAARMYVTNDEWQQTVLDLLQESKLVVLQPNHTEGVWWEIEKVIAGCPPEKVLFCLVNYRGRQEYYENFRERFEQLNPGTQLPRGIGNEKEVVFLVFDKEWKPTLIFPRNHGWIKRPFKGMVTNLNSTLKPHLPAGLLQD